MQQAGTTPASKRHKGARPETPLGLYKQALRLSRQQACGGAKGDAAIEAHLQSVVAALQQQQQQQPPPVVEHSLDLDVSDEPLFLLACAHWQLGLLYQRQDSLAAAEQQLRASLALFPGFVAAAAALAQVLRAAAASANQLQQAEQLLTQAIRTAQQLCEAQAGLLVDSNKVCQAEVEAGDVARSALAMLLCQGGRDSEAAPHLRALGFRFRLSREVLQYPFAAPPCQQQQQHRTRAADDFDSSCGQLQVLDGALPPALLAHLQAVFAPGAPFWREHSYGRVGYFSYFFPMAAVPSCSMQQLASHLQRLAAPYFPQVRAATHAEFWAHCRRHSSGHQLHFDSDDEGQGGVRHPIITCIAYLDGSAAQQQQQQQQDHSEQQQGFIGGPTLMTDQVLGGPLATRGWLAFPASNRVLAFDGRFLHGVIPGRGPSPTPDGRRTTLMMAFWRELQCRTQPGEPVGACMRLPGIDAPAADGQSWHQALRCLPDAGGWQDWQPQPLRELHTVDAVWAPVDGEPNGSTRGAAYKLCFQGF